MRTSIEHKFTSFVPQKLRPRMVPYLTMADVVLTSSDDRAVSQRIALFAFLIRVFSASIAYALQVLLARWMGEFEYGVFVSIWVAVVIFGGVSSLGFQTAIVRFIPEYLTSGDTDMLRGVLLGSRLYSFVSATTLAVIGFAGIWFFEDSLQNYYVIPLYLGIICLPMLALTEVNDGVARAFNWPHIALLPTFIFRPLVLLATMGTALAIGMPANAATAMMATIVAAYTSAAVQMLVLHRNLRSEVPAGPRNTTPFQWIAVAIPMFMVEGFYSLMTNLDILVLGIFVRPDEVAVYFAAVKTLALAHFVYFAVKAGTAHRFSQYRSAGNAEEFSSFVRDAVHWTFWPTLAIIVLFMVIGRYFLMLFGPTFVEGEYLLWILAVGIVVRATIGPAESVLTMSGQQSICAIVFGVTLSINLILNLTLIPIYGLAGAAFATTFALIFETAAIYAAAARRLSLHIFIIPHPSGTNQLAGQQS